MASVNPNAVPDWKIVDIMQYWRTHKDNRSSVVANHFNIPVKTIDGIISKELAKKFNSKLIEK